LILFKNLWFAKYKVIDSECNNDMKQIVRSWLNLTNI